MKPWKIGVITGAISGFIGALLMNKDFSLLTIALLGAIIGIVIGYLATKNKRR
ncbi:MAG: hypothetical protein ABIB79_00830 [archaeon]